MKYNLLSVEQDAKTVKGSKKGYLTGILYLAPAHEASNTVDMCPMSTGECREACLYGAGMAGVFPTVKVGRIKRTLWYLSDRAGFEKALVQDIHRLCSEAAVRLMIPAVRLNGTSDVPKLARKMAKLFPDVQFYDYTKIPKPWNRTLANYHLTFSHSGNNLPACSDALARGVNVAVVFSGPLPETWRGFPVVNGDESDLRFLDRKSVIVGLKTKGAARSMSTGGFIQIGAVAA